MGVAHFVMEYPKATMPKKILRAENVPTESYLSDLCMLHHSINIPNFPLFKAFQNLEYVELNAVFKPKVLLIYSYLLLFCAKKWK